MTASELKSIAKHLYEAEVNVREVYKVTTTHKSDLTIDEAYIVQKELVKLKLADGKRIIGPKMGLTSKAKLLQMNVSDPIYGYIFDDMLIDNGSSLSFKKLIHPKVEAEIAFVIGEDITGSNITGVDVLEKTEYIVPALEIIDSRYENFRFTLPDVIADNASSSRVVFGMKCANPENFELDVLGVTLSINGEIKAFGTGAEVLGHPANSVAMLANMLAKTGEKVKKGDIILTGALTEALHLSIGDFISAKYDGLGEVRFSVSE